VYTATSNDPNEDIGGHQRRVSLHASTRSRDVEVAVLGLEPQQTLIYESSLRGQHFVSAMSAAMEPVNRLGTFVFAPEATDPKPPTALQQLAAAVTARFPDFGLLTVVSYLTEEGDAAAGTPAVREARRRALQRATSTADGTAFGSVAAASFVFPKAAFDVARASGVTQPQIMVVELIPPLVIDDVDWSDDGPHNSFNVFGHNLVLQLGETVDVSFTATPLHDHVPGPESGGTCTLFGEPTPERITAILPEFDHEVQIDITVSRSDGVEAFGEIQIHLV
jgi:hypothetical protein